MIAFFSFFNLFISSISCTTIRLCVERDMIFLMMRPPIYPLPNHLILIYIREPQNASYISSSSLNKRSSSSAALA
jgi:hypothetical protein